MTKQEIIEKSHKFDGLDKCRKEPVSKLPLNLDKIPGLAWKENSEFVSDSINYFVINLFFKFDDKKASSETKYLRTLTTVFSPESLKNFTEGLAKELVLAAKGRDLETKLIKKALLALGAVGCDESFLVLYQGKVYSQKHRRGLKDYFWKALASKKSPYSELLLVILQSEERPWINGLKKNKRIRKIFSQENLLTGNNRIRQKKDLEESYFSTPLRKNSEKLIEKIYLKFIEESLLIFNDLDKKTWEELFVHDVSGLRIGRAIVWGLFEQQHLIQTFTVDIDGEVIDSTGNRISGFDFGKYGINPVHPVELEPEDIDRWKEYFSRTKLKQPINQLDRSVFSGSNGKFTQYLEKPELLPEKFWKKKMGNWIYENFEGFILEFKRYVPYFNADEKLIIEVGADISLSDHSCQPSLTRVEVILSKKTQVDITLEQLPDRSYSEVCRELELNFLRREVS